MNSIWIRHGECTDNVGLPSPALGLTPLTESGLRQADAFAASLKEEPGLVVHSPFARSIQTAAPILKRFPQARVEVWDIQEITILGPRHYVNSSHLDRIIPAEAYWKRANPGEIESEGAESFLEFVERVRAAVDRIVSLDLDQPAVVISHGHFMRGVHWLAQREGGALDGAAMGHYTATFRQVHIPPTAAWGLESLPGAGGYRFYPLEGAMPGQVERGGEA